MDKYKDKDWLKQKYLKENLSSYEIAKTCKIKCSLTIINWLRKFNIKVRNHSEAQQLTKSCFQEGSEPWNKGKTGVYSEATLKQMRESNQFTGKKLPGKKSWRWNGGSYDYYGDVAKKVWEDYWREKVPEGYLIHHVDKNFKNNHISNLALITPGFHTKIHKPWLYCKRNV
ncbi:HNH endonuclease [bacterium]|nr:HNH endonuclease [bacterium]